MRVKPEPGVYILTFDDFDPPWKIVITIDANGATVSPIHDFEWDEDQDGPFLRCGMHALLAFTPPDHVDLVVKNKHGVTISALGGTYAPA